MASPKRRIETDVCAEDFSLAFQSNQSGGSLTNAQWRLMNRS